MRGEKVEGDAPEESSKLACSELVGTIVRSSSVLPSPPPPCPVSPTMPETAAQKRACSESLFGLASCCSAAPTVLLLELPPQLTRLVELLPFLVMRTQRRMMHDCFRTPVDKAHRPQVRAQEML